jgi:hypothetical protein
MTPASPPLLSSKGIVISAAAVEKLHDILDGSDIPVAEALEGDNFKSRAFDNDEDASEYVDSDTGASAYDRTITLTEMQTAFYNTYQNTGVSRDQTNHAAAMVYNRIIDNLGETIESGEEEKFFDFLTARDVHLAAGGVIINDQTGRDGSVKVTLQSRGLDWSTIRNHIIPYHSSQYVNGTWSEIEVSYEIPIADKPDEFYLVTVTKGGGWWPAVTHIVFDDVRKTASWTLVPMTQARTLVDNNMDRLQSAMERTGLKTTGSVVTEYADKLKTELPSVNDSTGSHILQGGGIYVYTSRVESTAIIAPPDSQVFATVAKLSLVTAGLRPTGGEIPIWIEGEKREAPEKDQLITPIASR